MRVIGGELRGRKLSVPKDDAVRPTTDRVKESMFNLIGGFLEEDTVVYDLFSGTGGLGIEALSRGAGKAYFCDRSRNSYDLTRKNLRDCRLEDRSRCVFGDFRKAVEQFDAPADLVFLDPPYGLDLWKPASDLLLEKGKLRDGAVLVMEHGEKQSLKGLDPRLELIKERKYGLILVTIYRYREIPEGSGDQDEVAPIGEQ